MSPATKAKSSPKSTPRHHAGPTYLQMIVLTMNKVQNVQKDLSPRKGISVISLKSKIAEKYAVSEKVMHSHVQRNLQRALAEKILMNTKGHGLGGSVRFHNEFANSVKKLDDPSDEKEVLHALQNHLKAYHGRSDDSDDEKAAEAKQMRKLKKEEAAKAKPKKEKASKAKPSKEEGETEKAKGKSKKAAAGSGDGEETVAKKSGKASKKRAAAEETSAEEPEAKKSK